MINSYDIAILSEKVAALENAEHDSQTASAIEYDNTGSGLVAENVQEAIDELLEEIKEVSIVSTTTVTTSQSDTATITLLSNGVKVLNYNSALFPAIETNDILTIPDEYAPIISSNVYSAGVTDNANMRMVKISNKKLSAYEQADSDTGLYITIIYI